MTPFQEMESRNFLLLLLLPALTLGQHQCSVPGDCIGFSLSQDYLATERQCLEFCKATPDCQWYSHDAGSGFCNALLNYQLVRVVRLLYYGACEFLKVLSCT